MQSKKFAFILTILIGFFTVNLNAERLTYNMNPGWFFHFGETEGSSLSVDESNWDLVSLPHTMRVLPADLNNFRQYGRSVGWYRKTIEIPTDIKDKSVFLRFQGAMQQTSLYVNGEEVGHYAVSGYDSFSFDITSYLKEGENLIALRIDNTETNQLPPDGVKHDFILFGGLYRDVYLDVLSPVHISYPWDGFQKGVKITYPLIDKDKAVVQIETGVENSLNTAIKTTLVTKLLDANANVLQTLTSKETIPANSSLLFTQKTEEIVNPELWGPKNPYLYTVRTEISYDGLVQDNLDTRIGLRWVEWIEDKGFYLNGEHLKLMGTNRHQTWPYIGGALPNSVHRSEAEQLKSLGINWIRLSHYPHDPDFLDALDELGIMALAEGPTWMKRGDEKWMNNLSKSFESMIRRDRNHPSIIIWNACINHETKALPDLVEIARKEDYRVLGNEDIYCPMDFNHPRVSGNNALTLEHTGHTYPVTRGNRTSKSRSGINREFEQARRHMEMYSNSLGLPGNFGMASWCGYDYNTFHNSQAAIARHGIFDLFRIPKFSKWWHKSELTDEAIAYIVRVNKRTATVFSNADEITLYAGSSEKDAKKIATQKPDSGYNLKNPPFTFKLKGTINYIRAEGSKDGEAISAVWREPEAPARLSLKADAAELVADGSDIVRIQVDVLDKNGSIVERDESFISFSIEGPGTLIGENPVKAIAGQHIILVQSGYVTGPITVKATSRGLTSNVLTLESVAASDDLLYPVAFNAEMPSPINYPVRSQLRTSREKESVEAFSFKEVVDAEPGAYVESDAIIVAGVTKPVSVKITGGEYRIYVRAYTDKTGKTESGDALFVRVKASEVSGETVTATLTIGEESAEFRVTTR